MNRAEQMMKRAEDTGVGNNLSRKAIPGQYKGENRPAGRITTVLSRRGVVTGLALLLSAGMCGGAAGEIFELYTFTVVANPCTLTSTGASPDIAIGASSPSLYVNFGEVTRGQLTPGNEATKNFGVEMICSGLPYAPSLTITGRNSTIKGDTMYVSDSSASAAGFAVMAATSDGATETDKTTLALKGTTTSLGENTQKKILLTAWPTLMPDKNPADLKGVNLITGTVTITVSYN
ncbi:type 1 fimbrial protein [Salmonella enterica]|nr:type 1 fimbrial protein [Salmonella enterica]